MPMRALSAHALSGGLCVAGADQGIGWHPPPQACLSNLARRSMLTLPTAGPRGRGPPEIRPLRHDGRPRENMVGVNLVLAELV